MSVDPWQYVSYHHKVSKTNCVRQGNRLFIVCPECHRKVELPLGTGPNEYEVDREGRVFPDYVCREVLRGTYCLFAGPIRLINY